MGMMKGREHQFPIVVEARWQRQSNQVGFAPRYPFDSSARQVNRTSYVRATIDQCVIVHHVSYRIKKIEVVGYGHEAVRRRDKC